MTTAIIRRPAVAGYYYPSDSSALRNRLKLWFDAAVPQKTALAVIVPHGCFERSGRIAATVYAQIIIPRRCILLGPSHTGSWLPWSLMFQGAYRTPLGDVAIDSECAAMLKEACPFLEGDPSVQRGEHSIEVQIPFLQYLGPTDLVVTPIIIGSDDRNQLSCFVKALVDTIKKIEEPVLIVASSDLSHYLSVGQAQSVDDGLLDSIVGMNGDKIISIVQDNGIVMCGYAAVFCTVEAAKLLEARSSVVVSYGTSADSGGDPDSVIGYGSVVIN